MERGGRGKQTKERERERERKTNCFSILPNIPIQSDFDQNSKVFKKMMSDTNFWLPLN